MTDSKGALALTALRNRLLTLKTSAGYEFTLKSVRGVIEKAQLTISAPEVECPFVELLPAPERYTHEMGASYEAGTEVVLNIVAPQDYTDFRMENLLRDIRKCIFGGASDATGNSGVTLGGAVTSIQLVDMVPDLNMIESNRIYLLKIRLKTQRITYLD